MRNHLTRFVPVTAALALVLSACGSDDSSSDPIDTPDTTSTADDGAMRAPSPIEMTGGGASDTRAAGASAEVAASDMATDMMIAPYVITEFVVGDLPTLPDNSTGYVFDANGMPTADQVGTIAAALGVDAEPEQIDDGYSVYWRAGPDDGTAPSMTLWDDAMQSWNFDWGWAAHDSVLVACETAADLPLVDPETVEPDSAGDVIELGEGETTVATAVPEPMPVDPCPEPEPPVGLPSVADAEQRVTDMLAAMGVDASTVAFDTYTDDWTTSVTASEEIDGVSARSWGFSFGENAELQYAWGSGAAPQPVGPYPLVDLDTAIARLDDQTFGAWGGVPRAEPALDEVVSSDATVTNDAAVSEPMPVDVPEAPVDTIEPEEITVTLVDVQPDLWWAWDTDGSAWLVPAYRFIGDDGGWYTVPAVTDEYLVQTAPTEPPVTEPAPEPVEPPVTAPVETTVPVETVPVETVPGEPPVAEIPAELGLSVPASLEEYTGVAAAAGFEVRVIERNGEPLDATDDFRLDRVNVAVVGDGGTEYVVRATLDDGTLLGEADIPGVTIMTIAEVIEGVEYYPACGNEILDLDGVLWYPIDQTLAPDLWAATTIDREVYEVAKVNGFARVAEPGPGDDTGTFVLYQDGIARFVSDSGDLDVWLTTQALDYPWEC